MTIQESMQIVDELSVLKFFPTAPAARAVLAGKLIDWCGSDLRMARWLVDKGIAELDEYPGPETLRKLISEERRSKTKSSEGRDPYVTWVQPR